MEYIIYTDGACSGNPGPGGWAAVIFDNSKKQQTISGKVKEMHVIDSSKCIKCGACYDKCKFGAIDRG